MSAATEFWKNDDGLDYITPKNARWCEGFKVHEVLREMTAGESVLDFGCGDGRMTEAFDPDSYVGVDINPHAIRHCRNKFPAYRFKPSTVDLPSADVALCYTVLLHVPDDEIDRTVERLSAAAKRVLAAEILGRKYRRPGPLPLFQRELDDYVTIFAATGMVLHAVTRKPYLRYGGVEISFMDFRRA
ncbi:MAG: class I SAM-dependent methyltransferase [Burkholderiales bacterium]